MSYKVTARIPDEKTWTDFKALVYYKHAQNHRVTGEELDRALKIVMALEGWMDYPQKINIIQNLQGLGLSGPTHTKRQKILLETFRRNYLHESKIHPKELEEFIINTIEVTDDRTVDKYIKFLKVNKYIKRRDNAGKNTVWKINIPEKYKKNIVFDELLRGNILSSIPSNADVKRD